MNTIVLHADGGLVCDQREYDGDPLPLLGYQVILESGCSLRSFFRMMERYPVLSQLNPFSPSFLASVQSCPPNGCCIDGVAQLELSRKVEMTGYPGNPGMKIYVSFQGCSSKEICDIKSYWLEQLLDMPMALGRLNHHIFGDNIDSFEFDTAFNLFELIDGICWQLSFHNLPAQCRVDF